MSFNPFERLPIAGGRAKTAPVAARPHRVRCVLELDGRYLLVQHNSRRAENIGKWGLPGGRLKPREKPKAGLRRELTEELGLRVSRLVELGDWHHKNEDHRIFGCRIQRPIESFDRDEILAVAWFSYEDAAELAAGRRLRTGFELAAIAEFRGRAHA